MKQIPILKMGSILQGTTQVDMHDRLAMRLQNDLTKKLPARGAVAGTSNRLQILRSQAENELNEHS